MSAAVRVDLTAARYGRRVFDYIDPSVEGLVLVNRVSPWNIIYYHQADNLLNIAYLIQAESQGFPTLFF